MIRSKLNVIFVCSYAINRLKLYMRYLNLVGRNFVRYINLQISLE